MWLLVGVAAYGRDQWVWALVIVLFADLYTHRIRCFGIEVVWWHVAIEYRLALAAAPAARELVPDSSVYGIVAYV